MKIAVTGGTGFVGSHLLDLGLAEGHHIRALTRRPQPERDGLAWIPGSLSDRESLDHLVEDCSAVIHIAGVLKARDRAGFESGNVEGTAAMLDAAADGGVRRFVHVSSLAAREPGLSLYGESKAQSEALVEKSGLDWAIVRPPAVYGPGDPETLELFRMAKLGLILLPPRGRVSLIHATDLARLLLALSNPGAPSALTVEPDDGRPGGWSHHEFAMSLGEAMGKSAIRLSMPRSALVMGARLDQLIRGDRARLTSDRAAYFCHPDWVVSPARGAPSDLWRPLIDTGEGLAATARWYKERGWL